MSSKAEGSKKEKRKKLALSFSKFSKVLNDNAYKCLKLYIEKNECRLCELRTPNTQRSFFVYVPKKYKMKVPKSSNIEKIDIQETSQPSIITKKYLSDAKGTLLESDIVSVTDQFVCILRNKSNIYENYDILVEDVDEDDEDSIEERVNDSDDVEKFKKEEAEKISKEIDNLCKDIESSSSKENENKKDASSSKNTSSSSKDVSVKNILKKKVIKDPEDSTEITFEDEEGKTIEDVVSITKDEDEDENIDTLHKGDLSDSEDEGDDIEYHNSNVYFLTDLNIFFKEVTNFEDIVTDAIDHLEETEKDLRKNKIVSIEQKIASLDKKLKEEILAYDDEEKKLRDMLPGLQDVFHKIKSAKIKAAETKHRDYDKIEKTYESTKKMITDINMELFRLKEDHLSFLRECDITLSELLSS